MDIFSFIKKTMDGIRSIKRWIPPYIYLISKSISAEEFFDNLFHGHDLVFRNIEVQGDHQIPRETPISLIFKISDSDSNQNDFFLIGARIPSFIISINQICNPSTSNGSQIDAESLNFNRSLSELFISKKKNPVMYPLLSESEKESQEISREIKSMISNKDFFIYLNRFGFSTPIESPFLFAYYV